MQDANTNAGRSVIRTYHYSRYTSDGQGGELVKISYEDFDQTLSALDRLAQTIQPLDSSLVDNHEASPCACCNAYFSN